MDGKEILMNTQMSASVYREKIQHRFRLDYQEDMKRSRNRRARAKRLRYERRKKQNAGWPL